MSRAPLELLSPVTPQTLALFSWDGGRGEGTEDRRQWRSSRHAGADEAEPSPGTAGKTVRAASFSWAPATCYVQCQDLGISSGPSIQETVC